MRRLVLTALPFATSLAFACGTPPQPERPQAPPAPEASAAEPTSEIPSEPPVPNEPPPSEQPKHAPPKASAEHELTFDDCTVLADTYGAAWLNDALAKEGQKKDPKLQQLAEANVRKAGEEARERWLQACNGIVGSPFVRARLVCASKAKTVARFDACWDGTAE